MDINKILKSIIPKINKETLRELEDIVHTLRDKEPDELDKLIDESFGKLIDLNKDEEASVMLFLIGKELGIAQGKQEALKEQKIFIQGDY
ncbi:MAG: hypothetical protein KBT03_00260 [Bacteroidales bacterium]|nr:hypothetical protein [Candidatus Scybalousia scybalohippi]